MRTKTGKIHRRDFFHVAAAAAAGAVLSAGQARAKGAKPAKGGKADKPNVLWLTVEDMSANLGCWGDAYAHTPNIDRLAAQSVKYTNVFVTAPVCSPVRSCLITGLYATSLGTPNLRSRFPIPKYIKGYPSYLRAAGYYCTNNVKTDYNTSNAPGIIKASWDACSAKAHWRGRKAGQPFFSIFNDMTTHQSRSMVWPYRQFAGQIQKRLSPAERHDPAKAPLPPYYPDTPVVRRTLARFHDCVSVMDKNVGKLLEQLADDGLADDTIVFFYSDHGSGLPRHKRLLLDSGMHVPMLIRFPKKYQYLAPAGPGKTLDRLISTVDFPPTLLSLLGVPVPKYMQGRAFLGAAAGNVKPRQYVYGARDRVDEAYDLARCVRDRNYLYIRNYMPHLSYNQPSFYSDQGEIRREITALAAEGKLATGPQKHYAGPTRAIEELYDTKADPHQINNLAASAKHKQTIEKMRKLLRRWILDTRDLGFLPELDMARRSAGGTPYDMAKDADKYPRERILDAAELVGRGPKVLDKQVKLLGDGDSAVRYWAAVGLRALGPRAAAVQDALVKALGDASPAVRIEAAAALADIGKTDVAIPVLVKELKGANSRAALRAARALQLLGAKARGALGAMKAALKKARTGKGDSSMFIRFSLDPAVKRLDR